MDRRTSKKKMAQTGELEKETGTKAGSGWGGVVRRDAMAADCDTAVLGAGPYGLAAAAHLRGAGVNTFVFGGAMSFWRCNMPRGMLLRSPWPGCHISDPREAFTLDSYGRTRGVGRIDPLPLERFVDYGEWFQQNVVPDLDHRQVGRVESTPQGGFQLELEDGCKVRTRRVVVAVGLTGQANRPPVFDQISPSFASHYSEHADFAPFAGRRVAVVGAGQGALESAALLSEAGAAVEVLSRKFAIHWLGGGPGKVSFQRRLRHAVIGRLNPPAPIGPFPLNWMVEAPGVFRLLPFRAQRSFARRVLRPAGAAWLVPRTSGVRFRMGVAVTGAREAGGEIEVRLDDGSTAAFDHVLLATGYRMDIARYRFLSPELLNTIRRVDGHPMLVNGLESSVPRLHFLGAPAARDFGPLMRFVAGTRYAAIRLARQVQAERAR